MDEILNEKNQEIKREHEQQMIDQMNNNDKSEKKKGIGTKLYGGLKKIFHLKGREAKVNFSSINDNYQLNQDDEYQIIPIDELITSDIGNFPNQHKRSQLQEEFDRNLINRPKFKYEECEHQISKERSFCSIKQLMKAKPEVDTHDFDKIIDEKL